MDQAISVNSKNEYFLGLVNRYGFSYKETGNLTTLMVPKALGSGYFRTAQVSDDIEIEMMDLFVKRPIVFYYDDYPNTCEAAYCFDGHIFYSETGVTKANLNKNEIGIYALPSSRGMTMIPSEERVFVVSVVSKESFHCRLPYNEKCTKCDDASVKGLLSLLARPRRANAKTHNYFRQITQNDISMKLKDTYLDSLGKIILSDLWQENVALPLAGEKRKAYSAIDRKALLEAKEILTDQFSTPPTIAALAKMVMLNEYKLKNGFRDMYGKSIYEYVRSVRMKNASHLLENIDLSIGEIAGIVGYVNTSHFARAFRNVYGLNPSDYRLGV